MNALRGNTGKTDLYGAYGLILSSPLPLPELEKSVHAEADLDITFGTVAASDDEQRDSHSVTVRGEDVLLHVPRVARFRVTRSEIVIDPGQEVDDEMLRLYILGACLALVLHLRGVLVLHASAVSVDDRGVIFLGHKASGKSTTAASLVALGHKLITDDIVALVEKDGAIHLQPGFPQLKLFDEAVEASVRVSARELPRIHEQINKRAYRPELFPAEGLIQASHVFVLEGSDRLAASPLSAQEAFVELIRYTYVPSLLARQVNTRTHFDQCIAVASMLQFARLARPHNLARLPDVADYVARHVTASI